MKIRNMMNKDVLTASPETRFEELACKLSCSPNRAVYVVAEDGRLLGIVTSLDILARMAPFYLDSNLAKALPDITPVVKRALAEHKNDPAAEVMTPEPTTLAPDDTMLEADMLIRETGVNVLPVVDGDGLLVGEVTRKDILRHLVVDCCQCACGAK